MYKFTIIRGLGFIPLLIIAFWNHEHCQRAKVVQIIVVSIEKMSFWHCLIAGHVCQNCFMRIQNEVNCWYPGKPSTSQPEWNLLMRKYSLFASWDSNKIFMTCRNLENCYCTINSLSQMMH